MEKRRETPELGEVMSSDFIKETLLKDEGFIAGLLEHLPEG